LFFPSPRVSIPLNCWAPSFAAPFYYCFVAFVAEGYPFEPPKMQFKTKVWYKNELLFTALFSFFFVVDVSVWSTESLAKLILLNLLFSFMQLSMGMEGGKVFLGLVWKVITLCCLGYIDKL